MIFQGIIVNSEDDIKYFSVSFYDDIMRIEGVFVSTVPPNNQEASNWIALHVKN